MKSQNIFKNYKGSRNEIKNNEYKRQQLMKHQLFTADVDIKSWFKVLNEQRFFLCYNDNPFYQMLRFQSDPI